MRLGFDIVDVFTDRPFAGNQLAVVHGAEDLSDGQCQMLAREFGFSETSFPTAVDPTGTEYAVRIFTPEVQVPFAGHPTLGTAWVLRERGHLAGSRATQVCPAGRIGLLLEDDRVELSAAPRDLSGPVDEGLAEDLLGEVGLQPDDLAGDVWAAGTGLTFLHVPVHPEAVARAAVSARPSTYSVRLAALPGVSDLLDAINVYAVDGTAPSLRVHARVFVPGGGVPEDPATGSAATGLGMVLVARSLLPDGGDYVITQGVEMGRPSTLHGRVEVDVDAGRAALCHVGGQVRPVATGEIAVPPQTQPEARP